MESEPRTKRPRVSDDEAAPPPECEITTDEKWADATGDFEVVTADNVRFLVPSHMLFGASPVFRDAKHMGAPAAAGAYSVHLLDATTETAAVFRLFLALIAHGTIEDNYYLPHTHLLAAFLRKWQCEVAHKHLLVLVTQAAIDKRVSALRAWAIGAAAQDRSMCGRLLYTCSFASWGPEVSEGGARAEWDAYGEGGAYRRDGHEHEEGSMLDPYVWPMYMWTDVPPVWAMALARVYGGLRHLDGKWEDLQKQLAYAFRSELDTLEAAGPTHVALSAPMPKFSHYDTVAVPY